MKKNKQTILIYSIFIFLLVLTSQIIASNYTLNTSLLILISLIIAMVSAIIILFIINNFQTKADKLIIENKELSKSLERYDIVAKATSDTVWDWNIKTNEIIWNKGIENVFGYKENEVENKLDWWFSKIHPEDSLKMSVKLYSFIEKKTEKWQDNYRFLCADGTYKYVFDRGFIVIDENKNVVRMIGAIQDISKQKEEEQRLKLLETVITQTKDTVIITEIDSDKKALPKIIYVNPAFTSMTNFTKEEVIGKTPLIFMSKESIKNNFKPLAGAIKKREEFYYEAINHKKNNEEYWVNMSMFPIKDTDDEHTHWISIQRDITLEKQREIEREHLIKELTQNNKDLKQFSYITSHNLRAPLSNLTGLLNLIEDINIEDTELKEIIYGFSVSTNLLNQTVNDLVKVIVIKDNPSKEKEEIDIKEIINNITQQISSSINKVNPIIKLNLDQAQKIYINKSYFESILINLLTNSLKYRDLNNKLEIKIESKIENDTTILTFTDNGIGIDLNKNKEKVFGLYQRFHDYPDSKGLGLYLVKSQVESMGGTIEIESKVNTGTTFTLTFKNH
jgi:PAS domain S-box-containing protein